jgi:hypothetical protein
MLIRTYAKLRIPVVFALLVPGMYHLKNIFRILLFSYRHSKVAILVIRNYK